MLAGSKSRNTRVIFADSPYRKVDLAALLDPNEDVIAMSSLAGAAAFAGNEKLRTEIARREYHHYIYQTYELEVLGFQLLARIISESTDFEVFHSFSSHSFDEVRHVNLYLDLVRDIQRPPTSDGLFERLVSEVVDDRNFIRKIAVGTILLEGMAISLFNARIALAPDGGMTRLDQIMKPEEIAHQRSGLDMIAKLMKMHQVDLETLNEWMSSAFKTFSRCFLPVYLIEDYSLQKNGDGSDLLRSAGLPHLQARNFRKNFADCMRYLKDRTKTDAV